jgi:hypothetical protein
MIEASTIKHIFYTGKEAKNQNQKKKINVRNNSPLAS